MIINTQNLQDLFTSYNAAFKQGFAMAKPQWQAIATRVPSITSENHYAWLGQFPKLREWLGDRVVQSLEAYDYTIKNKKFEATIGVQRDKIEDDQYGIFSPLFQQMGFAAMIHPDEMLWPLLAAGNTTLCYDGQPFFDADHPVAGGSVSNVNSAGASNYWYLMDLSRPLKPMILQMRRDYEFRAMTNLNEEVIAMTDEFKFGIDGRLNAGFGFWQQAYASNQALNGTSYDAGWQSMTSVLSDQGRPMGMTPTHLIVGRSNRAAALNTIEVERLANGASNPYYKAVQVIVSPYLA